VGGASPKDRGAPTLLGIGPGEAPAPKTDVQMPVIGTILGQRFQLEAVLGRGGSGVVYRAFDRVMGEAVAVKVLRPEKAAHDGWIRRLVREIKVARLIVHPNVCRIFEIAQADSFWLITMELAVGTLGDEQSTDDTKPLPLRPWARRREDARAVCDGLAAIHASGISHRDVTPQNILRLADGRLVLSDFGLALLDGETTAFVAGTPNYVAPEVLSGVIAGQRSDVWQLGVVLHEIVFGTRPRWVRHGDVRLFERPTGIDTETPTNALMRVLSACLRTEPERRPGTALAIAQALEALTQGRRGRGSVAGLAGWASRAGAAAVLVALVIFGSMRWRARPAAPPLVIAPAAAPPVSPPAPTPPAPAPVPIAPAPAPVALATRIHIHIDSRPPRARVVDATTGVVWGFTPLEAERKAGEGAIHLRIAKAGFEPAVLTLDGEQSVSEFLGLHAREVTRHRAAAPDSITDSQILSHVTPFPPDDFATDGPAKL
jgi:hypothetical protein